MSIPSFFLRLNMTGYPGINNGTLDDAMQAGRSFLGESCHFSDDWWPSGLIPEQHVTAFLAATSGRAMLVYRGDALVGTIWEMMELP